MDLNLVNYYVWRQIYVPKYVWLKYIIIGPPAERRYRPLPCSTYGQGMDIMVISDI